MARKNNPEKSDLMVSAGAAAAPSRRRPAGDVRPKHSTTPAENATPAAPPADAPSYEKVARLAYSYWEARGCQGGSAEEDWIRAEQELGIHPHAATA